MEIQQREVGIIGAGMTGLCACKHLMQHGFKPTVFESQDRVGGIWHQTCSITKLQTSRNGYQFADFLWPQETPLHPHSEQVVDYLESYAAHFRFHDKILFNSKVVEVNADTALCEDGASSGLWGSSGRTFANSSHKKVWQVLVQRRKSPLDEVVEEEWFEFDFLVLCVGRFGDFPKYPMLSANQGPNSFSGKVMHSMEYGMMDGAAAKQMLAGKRVVVVGLMKSAIEVALEASFANQGPQGHPCHMIFRSTNWVFHNRRFFGKLVSLFYFTRFSELMNRKPGQGWMSSILSAALSPLKWACSKSVELYLLLHLPLRKYGLVPKHSFSKHAYSCKSYVLPDDFFPRIDKGEIILHKTNEWRFCKDGVVLQDGTFIPADIVLLGTGYDCHKKILSLLPRQYSSLLLDPPGIVPLYRGTIHPKIPHLAILGYQLKFSHLHSSEMSARWLAYFLKDSLKIPSVKDMEKDAQGWIEHMCTVSPFREQVCLGSAGIWHSDQMCKDMGWNPRRKKTWYQEFFTPYTNMDYKDA